MLCVKMVEKRFDRGPLAGGLAVDWGGWGGVIPRGRWDSPVGDSAKVVNHLTCDQSRLGRCHPCGQTVTFL